jgi:hypothetical protein
VMKATLIVFAKHRYSHVHRRYKGQYPLYHMPLSYH